MKKFIVFLCFGCILLSSCTPNKMGEVQIEDSKVESLDVFIVADMVSETFSDGTESVFYTSMATLGEFHGSGRAYGEEGFMFHHAFNEYERETGIELNITWFQYPEHMEAELESMSMEEYPDLILTNETSQADYYQYMKDGLFYDVTPYAEAEGLYTSDQYYNIILEAGRYEEKQYVLPILFNIDTVMGAKRILNEAGLYVENAEFHSDFISILTQAQKEGNMNQVAAQYNSVITSMLPFYVYASSGETWLDYENEAVTMDKDRFYQVAEFYKAYMLDQCNYVDEIEWANTKHMKYWNSFVDGADIMESVLSQTGCVIEGSGSFQTFLHSAAAQAYYFESRYNDMEEEFILCAIPNAEGRTTAHVSYFGAVLNSCEHPQEAYNFIRFLMDKEVFYQFGMPINIENNEAQIEALTSTVYKMRHGLTQQNKNGVYVWSDLDYDIQAMSVDTKEKLLDMVENISLVSLPNRPVYDILENQMQRYAWNEITLDAAYEEAYAKLEEYWEK